MVLAAALISLAVLGPPTDPQSARADPRSAQTDNASPYSVEAVRKAVASRTAATSIPGTDAPSSALDRGSQNSYPGRPLTVESRSTAPDVTRLVFVVSQPDWVSAANPTWHDQFLAMTGPENYEVPFSAMSNGQRLQATATNIGFALAFQAIASAIHDQFVKSSYDRKQKRVNKVRTEIQGELDELERANAGARQSGPALRK
jgi:hypothetical protein